MKIDAATKRWIRNASDERAVANGSKFREDWGERVLKFAEKYLILYEGDKAGEPLTPHTWQIETTMRLFGWARHSEHWGRWIRRFNAASIWLPKKQGKSPTLAWWGLYLLIADDEPGQKVYFGAKDGAQAREISGKHAIEMVQASEALMSECEINKSLMQITHVPTRSILKPISSSDSSAQKSKEGLNGCILIDECHVVDRAFMNRVSRAGISRREAMRIEVSTAGNDPDSYGKERYDYGKQIADGTQVNEQLFWTSWEAPQDLTDAALAKDLLKWGRIANPMMGYLIPEADLVADYNESKRSLSQLGGFKMYRLNIWQQSANPWLRMGDWKRCEKEFTIDDIRHLSCWLGLDLGRTQDMTAAVFVFRDESDDEPRFWQFPYFWLPEETAKENAHLASFLDWADQGCLKLTDGSFVNKRLVLEELLEVCEGLRIQKILYDAKYADELTERLEEKLGVQRQEFSQSWINFAGPTADYERLIIAGHLYHPGNPVLTWQVGHVAYKIDNNGNKRPIKPPNQEHKKIDGIVAGIMGLSLAVAEKEQLQTILFA